jgi:hypothetical protein
LCLGIAHHPYLLKYFAVVDSMKQSMYLASYKGPYSQNVD